MYSIKSILYLLIFSFSVAMNSCQLMEKSIPEDDKLKDRKVLRFASFNVSLNRAVEGDLMKDLLNKENKQAQQIAEIIQRQNPDVVALLEFDFDKKGEAIKLFQENYLNVSQHGMPKVSYKYVYVASSNTGSLMEVDINGDGVISSPGDTYGFGLFPGQYSFVLLSKYEIVKENIRTFQYFKWKDMPNAMLPMKPDSSLYYSKEVLDVFRLSSKNHVDIPIKVSKGVVVHAIIAHPTPPVFDGLEDRNGTRNHDEIRFLSDYVSNASYIYDDENHYGGLASGEKFVIMGDMNADPFDGESSNDPINFFETNALINREALSGKSVPKSLGGIESSKNQGGVNVKHAGNSSHDTADFGDEAPNAGNLRVDYVLPSANLKIMDSGVYWPLETDSTAILTKASDHKLVWIDLQF